MMQSAEDWLGDNLAAETPLWLGDRRTRRNLTQAPVRSPSIVVLDVLTDVPLQLLMAENQAVIEAFGADTSHPAFGDCIGSWGFHRRPELLDLQRLNAAVEKGAEAAIVVVNQESRCL